MSHNQEHAAADRATELHGMILEILEENAAFISYGDDDDVRYFAGVEALEALAWLVGTIAAPIFVNIASEEIKRRRTRREEERSRAPELANGAASTYRDQVTVTLSAPRAAAPDTDAVTEAQAEVAGLLRSRGWPNDVAETDAQAIVRRAQRLLRP